MNLKEQYTQRAKDFAQTAQELKSKYERFSFVRLVVFIVGLIIAALLWANYIWAGLIFTLLFLVGFYRFVKWHQRIQKAQQHHTRLAQINEGERLFLEHDYQVFANGERFKDPQHPYAVDLDIFGDYGFYQYINRSSTAIGEKRLAEYLQTPEQLPLIKMRQAAIADLQPQLEWRQHFQAYGMAAEDDPSHISGLENWLHAADYIQNNKFYVAARYFVPILSIIGIALWITTLPWFAAIIFFLPAIYILRKTTMQVNETHRQTTHAGAILAYYAQLMEHIEKGQFESEMLRDLQQKFTLSNSPASKEIARLSYIISQLNVRYNVFAALFNLFGLWDVNWVYQLEKWKTAQRENLPQWFVALQEFEAILSFSTLHYNYPEWIFPTFHPHPDFIAEGVGHPLINPKDRVANNISVPTAGHIKLLTGSNMAGKSTFLRTVGLNIVLANIGAPVCATTFRLPLLKVYTSMRTQDALHESTSSFYAELKRLKFIIEAVENKENIFFLLDEILKGTNSNDRHTGSKALIKQLIKSEGSGIIATHDLELGALAANYGGAIENLRIEVTIRDGKLDFDYKIKKGVSESFNATLLMQQMGIRIEEL
ncbi:MAG: hypothetical protein AB8G22_15850 [Saprospiraceae bacterium]